MSAGLGVDVLEVKRFFVFRKDRKSRFLSENYSTGELEYCFSFKDPAPHLAGTFAAKEAVFKALGNDKMPLSKIEIKREKSGRPTVYVRGRRQSSIAVSISHTAAVAVAVAMRK